MLSGTREPMLLELRKPNWASGRIGVAANLSDAAAVDGLTKAAEAAAGRRSTSWSPMPASPRTAC